MSPTGRRGSDRVLSQGLGKRFLHEYASAAATFCITRYRFAAQSRLYYLASGLSLYSSNVGTRFLLVRFMAAAILLAPSSVPAQSRKPEDLAVGKLLVVPRDAPDPLFAESVVLLVHYDRGSSLGLIVNRRSTVPISRALHDLKDAGKHGDPIFVGGPVEITGVMALVRSSSEPRDSTRVLGTTYLLTSRQGLERALKEVKTDDNLRVYVGYCGWSGGQLEREVRLGGWYIFGGKEDMVFDARPDGLWTRLIRLTELEIAGLFRNATGDGIRQHVQ
jgi:putative transcriptional regulator